MSNLAVAGLDFGMTNSILATYEPVVGPVPYVPSGAETPTVPTVIATVMAKVIGFVIGRSALAAENRTSNFKVRLPKAGRDARQWNSNPDYQSAFRFLSALLEGLLADKEASGFESLVVTVPESWLSGRDQDGVGALGSILKKCGVAEPRFISEPVAAASFFAYQYERRHREPYRGHVLVFDHGGSTLDLALVQIGGNSIAVIDGLGESGEPGGAGFGGVEFDRRVFAHLASRPSSHLASYTQPERDEWLFEFEQKKRDASQLIRDRIAQPDYPSLRDEELFRVGASIFKVATSVTLADLEDVFEAHFAPRIRETVSRLMARAAKQEYLDLADPMRFRFLRVGGFSQFAPAQRLLAEIVTAAAGSADVLKGGIDRADGWQAVAKGAALVAANQINVHETCPYTFGLVAYELEVPRYHALMVVGAPLADFAQPRFLDPWFAVATLSTSDAVSIKFYIERGGERRIFAMTRRFAEVLPDHKQGARQWQLGCRVDRNLVRLCVRSDRGSLRTFRMGDLFSMASGRFEEDEYE